MNWHPKNAPGNWCWLLGIAAMCLHNACSSDKRVSSGAKDSGDGGDSRLEDAQMRDGHAGNQTAPDVPNPDLARCEEEERSGIPGWKLNRDWSCACRLFDPEPGTELPAWGTWEKCPTLGPKNVDCRVIVAPLGYAVGGIGASVDVDDIKGTIKLALLYAAPRTDQGSRNMFLVFDAHGPTLNAMIHDRPRDKGCAVDLKSMHQGRIALSVGGKEPYAKLDISLQAVLGGDPNGA